MVLCLDVRLWCWALFFFFFQTNGEAFVLGHDVKCVHNTSLNLPTQNELELFCHCRRNSNPPIQHVNVIDVIPKSQRSTTTSLVVYLNQCQHLQYYVNQSTLRELPQIRNFVIYCEYFPTQQDNAIIQLDALLDDSPLIRTLNLCTKQLVNGRKATKSALVGPPTPEWPVEEFKYAGPCFLPVMQAIYRMQRTLEKLELYCTSMMQNFTLLNFQKLKEFTLQSLEMRMHSFSLEQLPQVEVIALKFRMRPIKLILREIQNLRTLHLHTLFSPTLYADPSSCPLAARQLTELQFENWPIPWFRQCPKVWSCGLCNEQCKSQQSIFISQSQKLQFIYTMSALLPSESICPCFNIHKVQMDVSVPGGLVLDEMHRFPCLQEYHQFSPLPAYAVERLHRNVFANLTHPEKFKIVQLSFTVCDAVVLETIQWLKQNTLNGTIIRIACWNLLRGSKNKLSGDAFEWPNIDEVENLLQAKASRNFMMPLLLLNWTIFCIWNILI